MKKKSTQIYVKPSTKLTKAQRSSLLERLMNRDAPLRGSGQPVESPAGAPGFNQLQEMLPEPTGQVSQSGEQQYDISKAKPLDKATLSVPPVAELGAYALQASQMWKDMGGTKSLGAKLWEYFRVKAKSHHETARDYFVSSYTSYKAQPDKFAKSRPDEARLFASLALHYENMPLNNGNPSDIMSTLPARAGAANGGASNA